MREKEELEMGARITEAALEAAKEKLEAGGTLEEAAEEADVSVQTIYN